MDNRRLYPRVCFYLTPALILLGVVLRSVCFLRFFDADVGYFQNGLLPTLSNALYIVALLFPAVCMALTPKDSLPSELNDRQKAPQALLLGLALTAFAVAALITLAPARKNDVLLAPIILGIPAAAYYILSAKRTGRFPAWLTLLGFTPAVWSIAAAAETYFDQYTTMNSPVKTSLHLGFMGFMFIVLGELRFRMEHRTMPRYSAFFLALGSYTCLVGSIPLLLATALGILNNPGHMLYAAVLTCAGLYGLMLLHSVLSPVPADAPSESSPSPADPQNTAE